MRRGHKFNAQRTEVDGIFFASKREATRYSQLRLLERAGLISNLKCQVKMPVAINGIHVMTYIADFTYWDKSKGEVPVLVTEDVKGFRTSEYKLKRRIIEAYYRTKITET